MLIEKLSIKNVGALKNEVINFSKSKMNLLLGENASGKTTILYAIYSIFSSNEVFRYNSCIDEESKIELNLINNFDKIKVQKIYTKRKIYYQFDKLVSIENFATSALRQIYYFSPINVKHDFTQVQLKEISCFLQLNGLNDILKISDEKNVHFLSIGQSVLLSFIYLVTKLPKNAVLLIDSLFSMLDKRIVQILLKILNSLKDIQIILAETGLEASDFFHVIKLPIATSVDRSAISPNYHLNGFPQLIDVENKDDSKILISNYKQNEFLIEEEGFDTEFKEIKGNNPIDSIVKNAEIYIIAFLNKSNSTVGTIKWGICDDRKIQGVRLKYNEKDEIRRKINERIGQATPRVPTDCYTIFFHDVFDVEDKKIIDMYIIEIKIFPVGSRFLYATASGDVYIKNDGGKQKLSIQQIQEEFMNRQRKQKSNR